ncbi:hypothetical protein BGX31_008776, partial [Mortierella sp. GBA43]
MSGLVYVDTYETSPDLEETKLHMFKSVNRLEDKKILDREEEGFRCFRQTHRSPAQRMEN